MTYQEFKNKFASKTNFLQFYQVVSAIPKHLVMKAKNTAPPERELYSENSPLFQLLRTLLRTIANTIQLITHLVIANLLSTF